MKVLVMPRFGSPYQGLLYREVARDGTRMRYVGEWLRRPLVDLALLPLELTLCRLRGWRVLHLHWVATFGLPGSVKFPFMRRVAQLWFTGCLALCSLLRLQIIWTAHNVLPHEQVFADDAEARRVLIRRAHTVIVHSQTTLDELAALGASPQRVAIIPMGTFAPAGRSVAGRLGARRPGPFRFLFFGFVRDYKGTEDLLVAAAHLGSGRAISLDIVGPCSIPDLRARLLDLAESVSIPVAIRFEHVSDDELVQIIEDADAVVLPFRKVTTSSSALLALALGRPLIIPALATLSALPDAAVVRYDGSTEQLAEALSRLATYSEGQLAAMGRAGSAYAAGHSWAAAAEATREIYAQASGRVAEG